MRCDLLGGSGRQGAPSGYAFHVLPLLLAAGVLAVLATRACGGEPASVALPAEALGTWVTDGADFEGRYLEVSHALIAFGQGGPEPERHMIRRIDSLATEIGRAYRIHYLEADGSVSSLDILLTPDGTLRLPHPAEQVWRRR